MGPTFVLMLREGLEASLIVGILLAYLVAIGRKDHAISVWAGVGAAVLVSMAAGAVLFVTASKFEGVAEEIFEGFTSLLAVGALTWMVFWMRRNAINIKRSLQQSVDEALKSPGRLGLVMIAFVMVVREGIETALFLFATFRQVGTGAGALGAVVGLGTAVVLGAAIYRGGLRLNLSAFFRITGIILLVVAAGLAAHGVHELIEAGIFPSGVDHVWSLKSFLPDDSGVGGLLNSLVGYNADPALTEVAVWVGYLLITGFFFFKRPGSLLKTSVATPNLSSD